MPVKKIEFIDKKLLTMYKEAQESVPLSYNHKTYLGQNSLAVEKQSADFLHSFIEGQISIADDAYDVMREYLAVLKKSSYKPIIENVKKAERTFKLAVISQNKQKTIAKRKTKELISEESLKKSNFSILKGKSGKNLSIAELLYIAQILDKEEKNAMKARKDKTQSSFYSLQAIRNFKNLLQTLSQKKIDEILQGVTPYTSEIAQLSSRFGTNRQKDQISNMAKSIAPVATVSQSTSPSAEPVTVSHPQKEDKKNDDEDESLAAMHTEQEEFDDDDFEDEEDNQEEQPVTSTASTLEAFREPVDAARLEFLRRNDFAVLRNKYRKTLSARDLILIAHMLKEEQKKALIARKNKKSSFYSLQAIQKFNNSAQSLAQTMINDVLQRKTPYNSDIDELV
ncbi:MAG: hypothetical protein J6W96_01290, partial [Alphaproteobacteria bacterium]|nr:hypothetical protein [Alphaproteobacteria bacterium]